MESRMEEVNGTRTTIGGRGTRLESLVFLFLFFLLYWHILTNRLRLRPLAPVPYMNDNRGSRRRVLSPRYLMFTERKAGQKQYKDDDQGMVGGLETIFVSSPWYLFFFILYCQHLDASKNYHRTVATGGARDPTRLEVSFSFFLYIIIKDFPQG